MLVLVVDTSTPAVTAAVARVRPGGDASMLAERVAVDGRRHAELLAPLIEAVFREAAVTPKELGAVVAGIGPGPFTGLRVGLMTAAAFADALGLPTYAVCSLDAIAAGAPPTGGPLLVATDARRREVYWATYDDGGRRIIGPAVNRPDEVDSHGCLLACGAGSALYADVLGLQVGKPAYPPPSALVALAAGRVTTAGVSEPLTPLYLRRPDAVAPGPLKSVLS